jgi:hypothetical protein
VDTIILSSNVTSSCHVIAENGSFNIKQQSLTHFLAHLAKGNVSFYHHFASIVVRRKLLNI